MQGILYGGTAGENGLYVRWTPHPVIVTVRDNEDCMRHVLIIPKVALLQGGGSSYGICHVRACKSCRACRAFM